MRKEDLVFAESVKCICGARLAYKKGADPNNNDENYWDCSDIILDKAIPSGREGFVAHTDRLPFRFWKIKSERI